MKGEQQSIMVADTTEKKRRAAADNNVYQNNWQPMVTLLQHLTREYQSRRS
jgi:hypothetical protein